MRALIITPDRDHNPGDWSGAFRVEAERLVKVHRLNPIAARLSINLGRSAAAQRDQLLDALARREDLGLELVAILCHGWRTGIQLGWSLGEVEQLAQALSGAGTLELKVALYACSTAKDAPDRPGTAGDGGFADRLRDALVTARPDWTGWVDAHDRAGHTTSNPYVRRMLAATGMGGAWLVPPGSPLWASWDKALHDRDEGSLRLRYPIMPAPEVHAELAHP